MASGCPIIRREILWAPAPSLAYLVSRKLGEAIHKQPNSLIVFIYPKLIIWVFGRMMFKMADLVLYGPTGGVDILSS